MRFVDCSYFFWLCGLIMMCLHLPNIYMSAVLRNTTVLIFLVFFFPSSKLRNPIDLFQFSSLRRKTLADSENEHNLAILATARFSLPELRRARIRMGKTKYQLLRRLSKPHQRRYYHGTSRGRTVCTQAVIKSVEDFVVPLSNPSTVYLTVPSLWTYLFVEL